ncbi:MAG TPA: copper chaperone PCu(A)C [Hyphomicrobiaceae bacterium]|nr:copper chaperone PCu(A)C [Hyphomicrobiaceae bacterium]
MTRLSTIAALCAVAALTACSQPSPTEKNEQAASVAPESPIALSNGWAAITPNGATVGAGYVTLTNNTDTPEKLLSVTSPRASHVELHEMKMAGAMNSMGKIDSIDIPPHSAVEFRPGGNHLMFIDITAPFKAGETAPITLTFEHAGAQNLALPVRNEIEEGASAGMDMNGATMEHKH